jgi:hypothetical protein
VFSKSISRTLCSVSDELGFTKDLPSHTPFFMLCVLNGESCPANFCCQKPRVLWTFPFTGSNPPLTGLSLNADEDICPSLLTKGLSLVLCFGV